MTRIEKLLNKTTKSIKVFIVGDGPDRGSIEDRVAGINKKFQDVILMPWMLKKPCWKFFRTNVSANFSMTSWQIFGDERIKLNNELPISTPF